MNCLSTIGGESRTSGSEAGLLSSLKKVVSLRGFAKQSRADPGEIASSRTPRNDSHFQRT